jgi:O-antigen/teichoic acid export membrane protein
MKRLLVREGKDSLIYLISSFIVLGMSLLTFPLLMLKLSPADFGVIAASTTVALLFTSYANFSIEQSIHRSYYSWDIHYRRRALGTLWVSALISVILFGIFSYVFLLYNSKIFFPKIDFAPLIELGLFSTILSALHTIPVNFLKIRKLPWAYAFYSVGQSILSVLLTVIFVLLMDRGLFGYYVGLIVSNLVFGIIGFCIMWRNADFCFDVHTVKPMFRFGAPLVLNNFFNSLASSSDRLLVQNYLSLELAGIYFIAQKFMMLISAAHEALKSSYGPLIWKTMSISNDSAAKMIADIAPLFYSVIVLVTLSVTPLSEIVIGRLSSDVFLSALNYIPSLALVAALSSAFLYYTPGIHLSGRTELNLVPTILNLLVLIILGPYLVSNFGINGVISLSAFAVLVSFLFFSYYSNKLFPISHDWPKFFVLLSFPFFSTIVGYLKIPVISTEIIFLIYLVSLLFIFRNSLKLPSQ